MYKTKHSYPNLYYYRGGYATMAVFSLSVTLCVTICLSYRSIQKTRRRASHRKPFSRRCKSLTVFEGTVHWRHGFAEMHRITIWITRIDRHSVRITWSNIHRKSLVRKASSRSWFGRSKQSKSLPPCKSWTPLLPRNGRATFATVCESYLVCW